jgi:hypothetical protein
MRNHVLTNPQNLELHFLETLRVLYQLDDLFSEAHRRQSMGLLLSASANCDRRSRTSSTCIWLRM